MITRLQHQISDKDTADFHAPREIPLSLSRPCARKLGVSFDVSAFRATATVKHMRKRHIILPVIVALAAGTTAVIQTNKSPAIEGLISEAKIKKASDPAASVLGSADDRTRIKPKEAVFLNLTLNRDKARHGKVRVHAPNGGLLNQQTRHLEADLPSEGKSLDFEFTAGESPGRYTVEVSQDDATKTLEFWVGEEPPSGKPGPNLTFKGTHNGAIP